MVRPNRQQKIGEVYMYDKETQKNIKKSIEVLGKTTIKLLSLYDAEGYDGDLAERLEITAEALQKQFGLDGTVMEEYRQSVQMAKETEPTMQDIRYQEAEEARDMIYALCDRLSDPQEIMRHVRSAQEMLEIWFGASCV